MLVTISTFKAIFTSTSKVLANIKYSPSVEEKEGSIILLEGFYYIHKAV